MGDFTGGLFITITISMAINLAVTYFLIKGAARSALFEALRAYRPNEGAEKQLAEIKDLLEKLVNQNTLSAAAEPVAEESVAAEILPLPESEEEVVLILGDNPLMGTCSGCGVLQKADRNVCFRCGKKIVSIDSAKA